MDSLGDLINKKVKQLDFDSKKTELDMIGAELERVHGKGVKIIKINKDRSILVKAKTAVIATELRFQQIELLHIINSAVTKPITAIRIVIG